MSKMHPVALVLLVIGLIALGIALYGWAFLLLWNHFIVHHVAGTTPTTFWGSLGPAILITVLTGASNYRRSS